MNVPNKHNMLKKIPWLWLTPLPADVCFSEEADIRNKLNTDLYKKNVKLTIGYVNVFDFREIRPSSRVFGTQLNVPKSIV